MRFLLLAFVFVTACMPVEQGSTVPKSTPAELVRVIDGDTIVVKTNNNEEHVRIIGIDATEKGECGSAQATAALKQMLQGQTITLERSSVGDNRDKYGRQLRYVHTGSGDVGLLLLSGSYVHDFPWYDHERRREYQAVADEVKFACDTIDL